ncbi:MAG: glycogen/starch/alpha-glucan phosphorylase, partial [Bacillota bacterium]
MGIKNKSQEELKELFLDKLNSQQGRSLEEASEKDKFLALGGVIRDQINQKLVQTNREYRSQGVKQVYYFSMEFLLGRLMKSNLINLGIRDRWEKVLEELGIDIAELEEVGPEAGLGNGGLGRLAAGFLDSLASLSLPGHGCGIRYRYGHFKQKIVDGYQAEIPDNWLKDGYIWEVRRSDKAVTVNFGGEVAVKNRAGKTSYELKNCQPILAVPYDVPVIGYDSETVNTLRLWNAEVEDVIDNLPFDKNNYQQMAKYRNEVETISEILYPDDTHHEGQMLRLKQEYFLVSAGLQSIIRTYKKTKESLAEFADMVAIHINDTHPALAIPELMRLLMDEEGMGWDQAWEITTSTFSFTNHTLLAEAMEEWPIDNVRSLLPRIYMIIEEINKRFCQKLEKTHQENQDMIDDMEIIHEGMVRMAPLAIVGSHTVNGVARLHTKILKERELNNFYRIFPERFQNKTNGVTQRRWLLNSNPELAELITEKIGDDWICNPFELEALEEYATDSAFQKKLAEVKLKDKEKLAGFIEQELELMIDPTSIFDVHIKRLHGYKRQLMNILHVLHLYNQIREQPNTDIPARTFIFAGKAAPGYHYAKLIIKLINTVGELVNNDSQIEDRLKVVFLPDYGVSLAEKIIPAAEVSEQISTASKEASGTGNMKMMMNGAITLGTMDGANIEIQEQVGEENIITFGLDSEQVMDFYQHGGYNSREIYENEPAVKKVLDQLVDGTLPAPRSKFEEI